MENVLLLPFVLLALWIVLGMVLDLIGVVFGIALGIAECVFEARRSRALERSGGVRRDDTVPERGAGLRGEPRRVIEIEGRRLPSDCDAEDAARMASERLVVNVRRALRRLVDGHRHGDAIIRFEPDRSVVAEVSFDGSGLWEIVLDASEEAWAWATDSKLELVDRRDGESSPLELYGTPGWWLELSGTAESGMHRVADAVADYLARRGVDGIKYWCLDSWRGRLKSVEYLRADGAEAERWFGPCHNQFYWDASRRCAVTQGNCIGSDDDVEVFRPDADGTALYVDVGAVEDAGATWHGLWVRTYAWDRRLEHRRLTLIVDGEPIALELRHPGWYIDHSGRYTRPSFEERSIFNAPPGLLRKIARARIVGVRLEGESQVIEKQFTRRNIACVRKFVRDNLVGEKLRQDE